jgi:hypothetical protein
MKMQMSQKKKKKKKKQKKGLETTWMVPKDPLLRAENAQKVTIGSQRQLLQNSWTPLMCICRILVDM